jgi:predicted dehydrogenase
VTLRTGIIGTGDPDGDGFAMAYRHADGYRRRDDCQIVACADVVPENAATFAAAYDVPDRSVYDDHERMLASADVDIVSVCVPPALHDDMVVDAAEAGVAAVHCEKPMALTWGDARRMTEACADRGVQLTINHQLRYGTPYREARRLVEEGAVGELRRVEFQEKTLYDNGTHSFDLANYFAGGEPVEWVLGGIDYTEENKLFGAHNESQAVVQWRYESGVYGLASTGRGAPAVGLAFRLLGTEGAIEISDDGDLSCRRDGGDWRAVDTGADGRYGPDASTARQGAQKLAGKLSRGLADRVAVPTYTERAIDAVVEALVAGERPELGARNALAADELVFAAWESARRRGRVELPLDIEDNPLESMVEAGVFLDSEDTIAGETADD